MSLKILLIISSTVIITSCADGWFGGSDNKTIHPGKRLNILAHEKLLRVDQNLSEQVIIPAEMNNSNWNISNIDQNIIKTENFKITNVADKPIKIKVQKAKSLIPSISPVIYDGNMIISNKNSIFLYDQSNSLKWKTMIDSAKNNLYGGGVLVNEDSVYATLGGVKIYNLSLKDGKILWQTDLESISRSAPIIDGNKIFITTVNNHIYALDKLTGEILWHHFIIAANISTSQYASPVIYKDKIIVPYSTGELYILDKETGNEIDIISLEKNHFHGNNTTVKDIDITPIISNDNIYVLNQEDILHSINLKNGNINWETNLFNFKHIWMAGNMIYLTSFDGQVIAISKQTGKIHWMNKIQLQKKDSIMSIVMANSKIIISTELGNIYELNPKDGLLVLERKISSNFIQYPIFANNNVYYMMDNIVEIWK
jgi:outer membrane protein assembly factor BamB